MTNDIVLQVGEMIGVDTQEKDISVSHQLPVGKSASKARKKIDPATIIVKFVRHDVKEKFYWARKELKNLTAKDLGYSALQSI